jgi:hypothetical protein
MFDTLDQLADAWWSSGVDDRLRLPTVLQSRDDLRRTLRRGNHARRRNQVRARGAVMALRRALARGDVSGPEDDLRDVVVTLVLLRHAAERAGLDAVTILGEAAHLASAATRPAFENARDHSPEDVLYTARAFGEA